jgi:perosamine synthetase
MALSPNTYRNSIAAAVSLWFARHTLVPYGSIRIDLEPPDVVRLVLSLLTNNHESSRNYLSKTICSIWKQQQQQQQQQSIYDAMSILSVRSGIDLYLQARAYPANSYILLSAINIPDMTRILSYHKLRVIPIDIDPHTLEPDVDAMRASVADIQARHQSQHRLCAVVVAHLWGRRVNMNATIAFARVHGVDVIEDCAEAFSGTPRCHHHRHVASGMPWIGHPSSDLVLFSFGTIKHATALGGGIALVRDATVRSTMQQLQSHYPVQSRTQYARKVLNATMGAAVLNVGTVNVVGRLIANIIGVDVKSIVVRSLRGFPSQLMTNIRQQPCAALLSMMLWRMRSFSQSNTQQIETQYAQYVQDKLQGTSCGLPGAHADHFGAWLFPIWVPDPDMTAKHLQQAGIDAYRDASQLAVVNTAAHECNNATTIMKHILYLPIHASSKWSYVELIASEVQKSLALQGKLPDALFIQSKL